MVRKESCPECKGNRFVRVIDDSGEPETRKCPTCGGQGYKIRIVHNH